MKFLTIVLSVFVSSLGALALAADKKAALTDAQKTFLAKYEPVRAALAADDLAKTKSAAAALAGATDDKDAQAAAKKMAAADSLKDARQSFKIVSKHAVAVAKGQPGYFHANCPMVPGGQGDWVQTSEKINNPYWGNTMLTCGSIQK
jgi:membrane fusion protein, copper/silver efflux system